MNLIGVNQSKIFKNLQDLHLRLLSVRSSKMMELQEQAKEFGVGAQILKDLGIKNINLLTSNKDTEFVGLAGFGLDVVEKVEVV